MNHDPEEIDMRLPKLSQN